MKKLILPLAALMMAAPAFAQTKAFYVKKGDSYTKYNLGVAEMMHFADGGHSLKIEGYGDIIDLDGIDYISLTAPVTASLTPSEQKQKLVDIGRQACDMVNLNENPALFNMIHSFFDGYYDESNYRWHEAPVEYEIKREYYDIHNEFKAMIKAAGSLAKGNPEAARALKAAAVNIYRFQDYHGIYTANPETEAWDKSSADHFELRFKGYNGENFSIVLKASQESTSWESRHFDIRFPKSIDMTFADGSVTIATAKLATTLVQDKSIDMTLDATVGSWVVKNTMAVRDNAITDKVDVTVGCKHFVSSDSHISGRNLVNYDLMYNDIKESGHYHDENDNCCGDDPTALIAHFIRAVNETDVIGRLQLSGRANGFSKLYNSLSVDAWNEESFESNGMRVYGPKILKRKGDRFDVTGTDEAVITDKADYLNRYTDVSFRYDGEKNVQGCLTFEVYDEEEDRYIYTDEYNSYVVLTNGGKEHLVSVHRDIDWIVDGEGNPHKVVSPWYYNAYKVGEDDHYIDGEKIEVDESQLVYPSDVVDHYYEVEPHLVFPDQTSFAFGEFFDELSFSDLVDEYNNIIDTYLSITGQDKEDDPDDCIE